MLPHSKTYNDHDTFARNSPKRLSEAPKRKTNFLSKLFKAKLKRVIEEEKKVIDEARKTNLERIIELLNDLNNKETDNEIKPKISWAISRLQHGNLYECEDVQKKSEGGFFLEIAKIYSEFTEIQNVIDNSKITSHNHNKITIVSSNTPNYLNSQEKYDKDKNLKDGNSIVIRENNLVTPKKTEVEISFSPNKSR